MDQGWQILLVFYYTFKHFLFSRLKLIKLKTSGIAFSILLSVLAIIINYELVRVYESANTTGIIKGLVWLPNITLIFIIADLLSSLLILPIFRKINFGKNRLHQIPIIGNPYSIFEISRLIFMGIIFHLITTTFWTHSFVKFDISEHYCFQTILKKDLITYYSEHYTLPNNLNELETYTVNPSNGSPLYIENKENGTPYYIKDLEGNILIDSHKDIITQLDNPELRNKHLHLLNSIIKERCQ